MRASVKELTAILISVLALVISCISIFLQFREVNNVVVSLVDFDATVNSGQEFKAKLVFSNNGNVNYLVSEVLSVKKSLGEGGYSYLSDGRSISKDAPFVLAKGDMKIVELSFKAADVGVSQGPRPTHFGVVMSSVDTEGKYHRVELWYAGLCVLPDIFSDGFTVDRTSTLTTWDNTILSRSPCPAG